MLSFLQKSRLVRLFSLFIYLFFTPFVIHFLDFSYPSFVDIDEIFTDLQSILCLQAKHDYV